MEGEGIENNRGYGITPVVFNPFTLQILIYIY